MFKYVIVILALAAVAAAQYYYSGAAVSGPSFHGPFSSSAYTGIRRGLPTGGYYYTAAYPAAYQTAYQAAAPAYYY